MALLPGLMPYDAYDDLPETTPEEFKAKAGLQRQQELARGHASLMATALPVGVAASVLPDPNATGVQSVIPGAVNGLLWAGGKVLDGVQSLSNNLGIGTNLPTLSQSGVLDTLTQHMDGSRAAAEKLIPSVTPTTPDEQALHDGFESAGEAGIPLGGATKVLGKTANTALGWLAPGVHSPLMMEGAGAFGTLVSTANQDATTTDPSTAPTPATTPTPQQPTPTNDGQSVNLGLKLTPQDTGQAVNLGLHLTPQDTMPGYVGVTDKAPATDDDGGLTWGNTALGVVGLIAAATMGPKVLELMEDLVGVSRAGNFAKEGAAYNDRLMAIGNSPTPMKPAGDAPLPPGVDGMFNRAANQTQDRNAVLNAFNDATAPTPSAGDQMRAQTGLVNNSLSPETRYHEFLDHGEETVTGRQVPSPRQHWQAIADGTDAQRDLYDKGRVAANETDNRTINQRKLMAGGKGVPAEQDTAVNFTAISDADLRAQVAAARADPVVAQWMDTANAQSKVKIQILVDKGMLTPSEGTRILNEHPNYLPDSDAAGTIEDPFSSRELGQQSGFDTLQTPAWELEKQHMDKWFKAQDINDLRTNIIQNALAKQAADPNFPKIIRESRNAIDVPVGSTSEGTLPVRINGELRHYVIGNSALRIAMSQSPGATGALLNAINHVTQLSRSAITGPLAATVGHVFPLINTVRSAGAISALRPAGMYGGYIDKALQQVTGGRLAFRGDPTIALGALNALIRDTGAASSAGIGRMLEPAANNATNRLLRSVAGDTAVNAWSARAQAQYQRSVLAEQRRVGAGNMGDMSSTPAATSHIAAQRSIASVANNVVPDLFRVNPVLGSKTLGNIWPTFVRINELTKEIQSIVGESSHSAFYRLNRNNPTLTPKRLAFETRNITGDPGTRGASELLRGYGMTANYVNIAIQDMARMGRAFKENPVGVSAGVIVGLGIPALAEVFSAMAQGPDAVNHYLNSLTDDQQASSFRIYHGGDPNSATQIPVMQRLRMFVPIIRQFISDVAGLHAHTANESLQQWAWDGLSDLFSIHITHSTLNASWAGLKSAIEPPMPWPITVANGIADTAKAYTHPASGSSVPGGDPRAPGYVQGADALTGTAAGNTFLHTIAGVLGVFGESVRNGAESWATDMHNHQPTSVALGNLMGQYKSNLQDSLSIGNGVLWNKDNKLAAQTPLVQRVEQSLDVMRPMATWKEDIKHAGQTRGKGPLLDTPNNGSITVPTDPTMLNMYATVGEYSKIIDRKMMPDIQDTRKQIEVLKNSSASFSDKVKQNNDYVGQLQQKYAKVADLITDMNSRLSTMAGRHVTVSTINWAKGPEQFTGQ